MLRLTLPTITPDDAADAERCVRSLLDRLVRLSRQAEANRAGIESRQHASWLTPVVIDLWSAPARGPQQHDDPLLARVDRPDGSVIYTIRSRFPLVRLMAGLLASEGLQDGSTAAGDELLSRSMSFVRRAGIELDPEEVRLGLDENFWSSVLRIQGLRPTTRWE